MSRRRKPTETMEEICWREAEGELEEAVLSMEKARRMDVSPAFWEAGLTKQIG